MRTLGRFLFLPGNPGVKLDSEIAKLRAYAGVLRQLGRQEEAEAADKRAEDIFQKYNPT